ncbi:hypothetical protein FA95DRAFT_1611176 [Auriscalpium vulgare]|uniref:Uncharacterized protein n=1 Tax=Auriscalpium vulgare TaxID=40419 RepID=A0ACB8RC51_9AGAM|nr:hypothetical protein FA95DRAFT_1611176 [Auriscalpium vulgare]
MADLPVETLREIFQYLPLFSRDALVPNNDFVSPEGWVPPPWRPSGVAIYQVCRRWRDIVGNFPELWTTIPLRSAEWAKLALERSGDKPISIHIDLGLIRSPTYLSVASNMIPHMVRARDISLSAVSHPPFPSKGQEWSHFVWQVVVKSLEQHRAPLLESFELRDFDGWCLPKEIFQGSVPPRLRELRLNCCLHPTSSLLNAPLTVFDMSTNSICLYDDEVEVEDEDEDEGLQHAYVHLSNALETFSNLRELSLCDMLNEPDVWTKEQHAIHFPRLEVLTLSGPNYIVNHTLSLLSVPATVDLRLVLLAAIAEQTMVGSPAVKLPSDVHAFWNMMAAHEQNLATAQLAFRHLRIRNVSEWPTSHWWAASRNRDTKDLVITASNPGAPGTKSSGFSPRIHVQFMPVPLGPEARFATFPEILAFLSVFPGIKNVEEVEFVGVDDVPWTLEEVPDANAAALALKERIPSSSHVLSRDTPLWGDVRRAVLANEALNPSSVIIVASVDF